MLQGLWRSPLCQNLLLAIASLPECLEAQIPHTTLSLSCSDVFALSAHPRFMPVA
ncbi:hypothetical protein [Scytonema sp. PCC 10023]|uniref:hypothetical protein n=1 Tax=Scytonema sp. PCC 10023 TaxID=1680591 RepID=UPI0039C72506